MEIRVWLVSYFIYVNASASDGKQNNLIVQWYDYPKQLI